MNQMRIRIRIKNGDLGDDKILIDLGARAVPAKTLPVLAALASPTACQVVCTCDPY